MGEFIKSNDYDYEVDTKLYDDDTVVEREVYGTIKVIDLLNKIANNEEVPNIIIVDESKHYYNKDLKEYINEITGEKLFEDGYGKFLKYFLNDEIEIFKDTPKEDKKIEKLSDELTHIKLKEDKKIEKLSDELTHIKLVDNTIFRKTVVKKINEIIDKVNGE